tara:strand:+ start:83 stop:535 length:453 start_codon:yes stop_codon:yes gene_type:complete
MNEINVLKPTQLNSVSFKQFESFLNSLGKERKSWSLDLQNYNDEKDFYKNEGEWCIAWLDNNKIISFIQIYTKDVSDALVSFIVKKEYQGKGLGTQMLIFIETPLKNKNYNKIYAKHYKDNIASHKAFLKAGYKEWKEENNLCWKIKELK